MKTKALGKPLSPQPPPWTNTPNSQLHRPAHRESSQILSSLISSFLADKFARGSPRTPCGSCTKRDTVSRCIYSPAAAEKVDLHSLNNRLIQVEAAIAMFTAGKMPPPFQSSYPLAQVALPSTHSTRSRVTHSVPFTSPTFLSIPRNDLMNIWLAHCHLDIFPPGTPIFKAQQPPDAALVKTEPSTTETLNLSPAYAGNTIVIDEGPSTSSHSHFAQHNLPSLHVYYSTLANPPQHEGHQPISYTYPTHNAYPGGYDGVNGAFPPQREYEFPATPQQNKSFEPTRPRPCITPALLSLLPPPATRTKLLTAARAAHPQLTLLIPWAKLTELADPETHRTKALARSIFLGHPSSPGPSSASAPPSPTTSRSLPLFACLCYVLALGAREPDAPVDADPSFWCALAAQATGVWEEYHGSMEEQEYQYGHGKEEAGAEGRKIRMAEREREEMDHLVAGLFQVRYLLRTSPPTSFRSGSPVLEALFPLIGKLVNSARSFGFARDPEEDTASGMRRSQKAEERRRTIWWDIMFFDALTHSPTTRFLSDALAHTPLISTYSYTTKLPSIAQLPSTNSQARKYPPSHPDDCFEGEIDVEQSGTYDLAEPSDKPPGPGPKSRRVSVSSRQPPLLRGLKVKNKSSGPTQPADDAENGFFGVRCRLTRLLQTVKDRLAHPGCECCTCGKGHTLDQAARIEAEIRAWNTELPLSLKFDTSPPGDSNSTDTSSQNHSVLAAELAILTNRMIISAYVPLMRPPTDVPSSSSAASASAYSASHPWSPASRATVDAAQGVVRAARALLPLMADSTCMIGAYYPLEKAVVDALVICAHAGLAAGKSGRVVIDEVNVALDVFSALPGEASGELARIVGSLRRRVSAVMEGKRGEDHNVLKRKHHVLENAVQGEHQGTDMSVREGGVDSDTSGGYVRTDEGVEQGGVPPPPLQHRPAQRASSPPRNGSVVRGKSSEKKHSRKPYPAYPAIGIRDRGKEGAPWIAKRGSLTPPNKADGKDGDNNANFQPAIPPQQQLMLAAGYRSRSSSITQAQGPRPQDYNLQFGSAEEHANQRRRLSIHENGQHHQPPQQQEQPHQTPFTLSPTSIYAPIQQQQATRLGAFETPRAFEQSRGSFEQEAVIPNPESGFGDGSSPSYPGSNAALSNAGSPYGQHPQTPTFASGTQSLRHTPPAFGPQSNVASPQSFFPMQPSYEPSFVGQQETELSMDGSMRQPDAMGPPNPSVPSAPLYEKTQQSLYDVKPPVELQQQQQQRVLQHYQMASGRGTPVDSHHLAMNPPAHPSWAPTPQYMQHPQPVSEQNDANYWNSGYYS
ncbi:hypothetical protein H0H81_005796 [Sphagnurus paluster]|uniref:Transcription factor domain-containing protein n=1 Tax=Sphagnurus paluster TaxID=117069 RepID=A0A9P7KL03_9AGAR|nr:hypothetical protein H0H81_005796 [Sphagnurus paluster]